RRAEELITEGRVQVNGTVVTELGSKADPSRDHIRVDGKLLHGAERHRYYILNKPKGYVTTVSDPEGRPTVMTFFEKMRERLYPVGRLDYLSEGLLLVTNDGELANKLTKAGSGVEKTYLVKVAGQPSEDELDKLRSGVAIDRGQPGSGRVHTAPARIRQVRQGDNPWYEVVLIEGRNRELRKMFSAIGHFVEKIRRVGYGPLVLDIEPGKLRELEPDELSKLQLAAEGKWRAPQPKLPGRMRGNAQVARPTRPDRDRTERPDRGEFRPKRQFGVSKPFRNERQERGEFRPRREVDDRDRPSSGSGFQSRPFRGKPGTGKPDWKRRGGERPPGERIERQRPAGERTFDRPRPTGTGDRTRAGFERNEFERPRFDRPRFDKPKRDNSKFDRPRPDRPRFDKPRFERTDTGKPPRRDFGGPARQGERTGERGTRPPRKGNNFDRSGFADRGQTRTRDERSGSRPFKPAGKGGARPSFGDDSRSGRGSGPRPGLRGQKSQSRGFSKPGERKSGFKSRPGGQGHGNAGRSNARRSGQRNGGKRRP
ncbi:MAG TPA: pseudouridine synthase, partial [Terracidiphilus sp.]